MGTNTETFFFGYVMLGSWIVISRDKSSPSMRRSTPSNKPESTTVPLSPPKSDNAPSLNMPTPQNPARPASPFSITRSSLPVSSGAESSDVLGMMSMVSSAMSVGEASFMTASSNSDILISAADTVVESEAALIPPFAVASEDVCHHQSSISGSNNSIENKNTLPIPTANQHIKKQRQAVPPSLESCPNTSYLTMVLQAAKKGIWSMVDMLGLGNHVSHGRHWWWSFAASAVSGSVCGFLVFKMMVR